MSAKKTLNCTYCGAEFAKYVSTVKKNNFCCKDCYSNWQAGQVRKPTAKATVRCTNCATEFVRYRHSICSKNFCCKECRLTRNRGELHPQYQERVTVHCAQCGAEIAKRPKDIKQRSFCNKVCRDSYNRALTGEKHPHYKSAIFTCAQCGAGIERHAGAGKRSTMLFCNRACKTAWHAANSVGAAAPNWRGGNMTVHCAACNAAITRPPNRIKRAKNHFCNRTCFAHWKAAGSCGENNPNWRGGYEPYYGPNWERQAKAARERDGYVCQLCGKTTEQNGTELDVHHIKPFRSFAYIKGENDNYQQANELANLISLCKICHGQQQREREDCSCSGGRQLVS